ncbi:HPP family protein [Vibrio sp. M60_M31a]
MGKTWPLVGGHVTAALVGIGYRVFDDLIVLITPTITCTILIMIILKCVHPPGVATALVLC